MRALVTPPHQPRRALWASPGPQAGGMQSSLRHGEQVPVTRAATSPGEPPLEHQADLPTRAGSSGRTAGRGENCAAARLHQTHGRDGLGPAPHLPARRLPQPTALLPPSPGRPGGSAAHLGDLAPQHGGGQLGAPPPHPQAPSWLLATVGSGPRSHLPQKREVGSAPSEPRRPIFQLLCSSLSQFLSSGDPHGH